jgi:hypothetical protein
MFRLLGDSTTIPLDSEGLLRYKHPHVAIPSHFNRVIAIELGHARGLPKDNELWVANFCVKAEQDVAQIWGTITKTTPSNRWVLFGDHLDRDGFDRIWKYLDNLLECWHEMRPALEKSALVAIPLSRYDLGTKGGLDSSEN